jgi:hypothetical protein
MPRKYTKKSDYWNKFSRGEQGSSNLNELLPKEATHEPSTAGESYYLESSTAAYARNVNQIDGNGETGRRNNRQAIGEKKGKYKNIEDTSLPYSYSDNYITPRKSIKLCQKAYANIPIFRNAVDVMAEFANSDIYLEGGSEKSRAFIEKWLHKIESWKLKDQYFREYYRSGNVFIYKIPGKFTSEDMVKLNQVYGSESKIKAGRKIPIKYIFLNPHDFVAERTLTFGQKDGVYKKLLSEYDIERLKNPQTEYDKEVFDALPDEAKKKISSNQYLSDGVKVYLDPEKLVFSFYKKQDYEPFAIPFGFPVLDDINWKMELKKIDQAITRTIENVILLVTMGNTPDKGGINPNNLQAMQRLFENESIGRALIADYTTKAEFIIPDLNKVLGPTKYQIVNEDIKEGLQNIIVGKENYSSTQIKAQIFLERLKEARNAFLNDVMQPQVKEVCKTMGFRNFPTAKFVEIDIKDEVQLQRVASRLIEMGIITPEQGMTALKQGIYPDPEDLRGAQEKFVEDREKGYYTPLAATQPILSEEDQKMKEEEHDANIEKQKAEKKMAENPPQPVVSVPQEKGRPAGTNTKTDKVFASEDLHSRKDIQGIVYKIEELQKHSEGELRKRYNKKRLSKQQKQMISDLTESVVMSKESQDWEKTADACIKDFDSIEQLDVISEILELSEKHELVPYPAAILYHSKKINK